MRRRYSEEEKRKAINAYLGGLSLESAALKVGAKAQTLRAWLVKDGVEIRKMTLNRRNDREKKSKKVYSEEEKRIAINAYLEGLSLSDAAGKIKATPKALRTWLIKEGIELRKVGRTGNVFGRNWGTFNRKKATMKWIKDRRKK